jgi:hypothetical protein
MPLFGDSEKNEASIQNGSHNIIIQGAKDSPIHLQQVDWNEFQNRIEDVFYDDFLLFLVIATTKQAMLSLPTNLFDNQNIIHHYNDKVNEWKPFGTETISALLSDFQKVSGYRVSAVYVDFSNVELNQFQKIIFKDRRKSIVVIPDIWALHFSGNADFAQLFDEPEVGGCLIPTCADLNIKPYHQGKIPEHFASLDSLVTEYAKYLNNARENKGYLQLDMDIKDKDHLFRRLTHIAHYYKNLKPRINRPELERFGDIEKLH